jgi:hypothetical protein
MISRLLQEIAERHDAMRREALRDRTEEYEQAIQEVIAARDAAVMQHSQDLEDIIQDYDDSEEAERATEIADAKRELWQALQDLAKYR